MVIQIPHPSPAALYSNGTSKHDSWVSIKMLGNSMEDYLAEVTGLFETALKPDTLHALSQRLQSEFHERLQESDISMLPSYHHSLPTGRERGTFLALDMGGSNFRLALVELRGKRTETEEMHVRRSKTFPIDDTVRALKGPAFFEWVADRIEDMLDMDEHRSDGQVQPLSMGLAWSFPIEQTSTKSGHLLQMGKGFAATNGLQGRDLGELIMEPCTKRGLNVQLQTIVNDSSATLLAEAYREPSTRMSLILGTGTNSAIFLPVTALFRNKYGRRSDNWHDLAKHVIVNTELSMHGKNIWPATRWDRHLNETHTLPDFQPFEHLVGGRYLGEIMRLVLIEAIDEGLLFEGETPRRLREPYALDAGILAAFESDETSTLANASKVFTKAHTLSKDPTVSELKFLRSIPRLVSNRAAAFEATAVHALWSLRAKSEGQDPTEAEHVTIACNGSILEKYPNFRIRCQGYLDQLATISGAGPGSVVLEMAPESSIFGAAVAASCIDD